MKILLIKQTSLGDVIHSTLALEAIKSQYPDAEIHFMVDKSCRLAVEYNPHIDKLFVFDKVEMGRLFKAKKLNQARKLIKKSLEEIKENIYDIAIDLQGIERSVFFLYFCKAKNKFVKGKKPFLKGFKNIDKNDHALIELRGTLKLAGIDAEKFFPKLYLKEEGQKTLFDKLPSELSDVLRDPQKKLILMSPYTSWVTKDFSVENYLKCCELMAKDFPEAQFAFIGTPDKKAEIDQKVKANNTLGEKVWNLAGVTDIQDLQQLIKLSDLTIASEGAVGHIASALDVPVCVIFGPTQPTRVGPWGSKARVIQSKSANCLSCYKRKCDEWICMDNLEDQISHSVKDLLS